MRQYYHGCGVRKQAANSRLGRQRENVMEENSGLAKISAGLLTIVMLGGIGYLLYLALFNTP